MRAKLQATPLEEKAVSLRNNATNLEADLNETIRDMKGECSMIMMVNSISI